MHADRTLSSRGLICAICAICGPIVFLSPVPQQPCPLVRESSLARTAAGIPSRDLPAVGCGRLVQLLNIRYSLLATRYSKFAHPRQSPLFPRPHLAPPHLWVLPQNLWVETWGNRLRRFPQTPSWGFFPLLGLRSDTSAKPAPRISAASAGPDRGRIAGFPAAERLAEGRAGRKSTHEFC